MANSCYYNLKCAGTKENVSSFIRAMQWDGEYQTQGIGRVFDCYICEEYNEDDRYVIRMSGDCAWSILSAMRASNNDNNIEKLSKKLNLSIEAYSSECGCCFQEHFCVINGEIHCDECVDYMEIDPEYISELDDNFWNEDLVKIEGLTKENYEKYITDSGYIELGGYKYWDWFYV